MKKNEYLLEDLSKALRNIRRSNPEVKRISMDQLEVVVKLMRTPVIYNIDSVIKDVHDYLVKHKKEQERLMCTEKTLCAIIKVKKLTLHQWRKRGLIPYYTLFNRSIRYDLVDIERHLIEIKNKNIPVPESLL